MTEFVAMPLRHDDTDLQAQVAVPQGQGPFPTVIAMHSALGMGPHVLNPARRLAEAGYLAIATDMYGADADISNELAAGEHFVQMIENPELLRARAAAWFAAVAARDDVDPTRIAAIGYCFGGQCVLELARSGADLKATVSYHGLLTTHAPAQPGTIAGEVAVYCGEKDPYAPPADIEGLRAELAAAGVRYQVTVFGDAEHGFTDPDAGRSGRPGISYHALSDRISWAGTLALLDATLRS